jgi:cytochrome c oxidase cbb3-type subunit 3
MTQLNLKNMNMKTFFKYIPVLFLSLATMSTGAAQASDTSGGFFADNVVEITLGVTTVVSVIVLLVLFVVLNVLRTFVKLQHEEKLIAQGISPEEAAEQAASESSLWHKMMKAMTKSVPIEQEDDVLTDHEYDGIRELDNRLPPWWTALFYVTIIFAVIYLLHYQVLQTGPTQDEEYEMQMAEAAEQIKAYQASLSLSIDETNVEVTDDPTALAEGEQIFTSQCAACHANDGGGGVGPNMTDEYWIHGGDIKDIFSTIKYGVPQKGMISWQSQLTPSQMQNVGSYILTLQGTTPANPKEPQGELYVPAAEESVEGAEGAEEGAEEAQAISMK